MSQCFDMQKQLTVKRIAAAAQVAAADVSRLLDEAHVAWNAIDVADWEESWPYKPDVRFRIAHTGASVLLEYAVEEQSVRSVAGQDHGRVWEDSCCEFFFSPEGNQTYYNVESNCTGRVLLCCGDGRHDREKAPAEVMTAISRCPSLGADDFEERLEPTTWTLALVIPVSSFFRHSLKTFDGLHATANFYKCGDKLAQPHFLSWNRIEVPAPDFHRPDFFGRLDFE